METLGITVGDAHSVQLIQLGGGGDVERNGSTMERNESLRRYGYLRRYESLKH